MENESWAVIELHEPEVHQDFRLVMKLRHASSSERDPSGASTQLIISTKAIGFPLALTKIMAVHSQVNLLRKEWIKDCERLIGKPGGPDRLHTAVLSSLVSPKLLPVSVEDFFIRNFILQHEAPDWKDSRPGVMVMESSPPEGMTHFDDFEFPKPRRAVVRITGTEKLNLFMPGINGPDFTDVLSSVRLNLPVPSWLISLDLLKRFLADIFSNSLRMIKANIVDQWSQLEFEKRMAMYPELFEQIQGIIDAQNSKA